MAMNKEKVNELLQSLDNRRDRRLGGDGALVSLLTQWQLHLRFERPPLPLAWATLETEHGF